MSGIQAVLTKCLIQRRIEAIWTKPRKLAAVSP